MQDIPGRERTYTESWVDSITKGGWEQRKRFWEIFKPSRWEGFDRSLNSVEYEVLRNPQILFLEWFGGEGVMLHRALPKRKVSRVEREEPVNVPEQDSSSKLSTLDRRGSCLQCWQDEKSIDRDDINEFRSKINREKEVSDKKKWYPQSEKVDGSCWERKSLAGSACERRGWGSSEAGHNLEKVGLGIHFVYKIAIKWFEQGMTEAEKSDLVLKKKVRI